MSRSSDARVEFITGLRRSRAQRERPPHERVVLGRPSQPRWYTAALRCALGRGVALFELVGGERLELAQRAWEVVRERAKRLAIG